MWLPASDGEEQSKVVATISNSGVDAVRAEASSPLTQALATRRSLIERNPGWRVENVTMMAPDVEVPWVELAVSVYHMDTYFLTGLCPSDVRLAGSAWWNEDGLVLTRCTDSKRGAAEIYRGDGRCLVAEVREDGCLAITQRVGYVLPRWEAPPSVDVFLGGHPLLPAFTRFLNNANLCMFEDHPRLQEPLSGLVRLGWMVAFYWHGLVEPLSGLRLRPLRRVDSWWQIIPEPWKRTLDRAVVDSANALLQHISASAIELHQLEPSLRRDWSRWRLQLEGVRVIVEGVAHKTELAPTALEGVLAAIDKKMTHAIYLIKDEEDRQWIDPPPESRPEDWLFITVLGRARYLPESAGGHRPWWWGPECQD